MGVASKAVTPSSKYDVSLIAWEGSFGSPVGIQYGC